MPPARDQMSTFTLRMLFGFLFTLSLAIIGFQLNQGSSLSGTTARIKALEDKVKDNHASVEARIMSFEGQVISTLSQIGSMRNHVQEISKEVEAIRNLTSRQAGRISELISQLASQLGDFQTRINNQMDRGMKDRFTGADWSDKEKWVRLLVQNLQLQVDDLQKTLDEIKDDHRSFFTPRGPTAPPGPLSGWYKDPIQSTMPNATGVFTRQQRSMQ